MTDVLVLTLELAVPIRIAELERMTPVHRQSIGAAWRADAADAVACRGDALQFGGKRGAAAAVFNDLARGLAVLSRAPGGVRFRGLHWCVEHPGGTWAQDLACTAGAEGHR